MKTPTPNQKIILEKAELAKIALVELDRALTEAGCPDNPIDDLFKTNPGRLLFADADPQGGKRVSDDFRLYVGREATK